jgi:hypothetical protein
VTAQDATPEARTDCIEAEEPNDQFAEAIDLGSGEACATASDVPGGQDLYRWTVGPDDATTRWTISVTAIEGQLSKIEPYRVVLDDAGVITEATKLISVGGDMNLPSVLTDAIFPVDTIIVIGVATSGAGSYTLSIERGRESPPADDTEPNDDAETATGVEGAFALSGDQNASVDVIAWTVSEDDLPEAARGAGHPGTGG